MSLGRSSRFYFLGPAKVKYEKVLSPFASASSTDIHHGSTRCHQHLGTDVGKPWWIWKCSSSWEHAQALRVIGSNWDALSSLGNAMTFSNSEFTLYCWVLPQLPESFHHLHFVPSLHRQCAILPWVSSISGDKQNHPLRCLQQGSPHHPFWCEYAILLNSFKWSIVNFLRLVWRVPMIFVSKGILFAT